MDWFKRVLLDEKNLTVISMALLVGAMTEIMPLWRHTAYAYVPTFVVSLFSLVVSSRKLAARRRRANGLCAKCGYDLRATPGRCPECGVVPESGSEVKA